MLPLSKRAWELALEWLSTSTLSIVLFCILIPVAVFIATVIYTWRQQGRIMPLGRLLKASVGPTLISVGITAATILCLWVAALVTVVSKDHNAFLAALAAKDAEITALKETLRIERDRNGPKLSGRIFDLGSVPLKNGTGIRPEMLKRFKTYVLVRAAISNNGTQSIAKGWHLEVETSTHKKETALRITLPANRLTWDKVGVISGADALEEKTYLQPIPNGAEVSGALAFVLESISSDELSVDGARAVLFFYDNTGVEYQAVWTRGTPTSPYKQIPGFRRPEPR